jgi:hypothetical protein
MAGQGCWQAAGKSSPGGDGIGRVKKRPVKLERVKGIEPSFRSRKADTHYSPYYQHIQTRLT